METPGLYVIDKRMQEAPPETAIQVRDNSPASMMIAAMTKGMDLDKLEKFMQLQERWEANEAKKAYTQAMADFKKNPPKIDKDRRVKFETTKGITEYSHASLANVTEKINGSLGQHGLSAAWATVQDEKGGIKVTCTITHSMGHSESTYLTAAPDISGSKNAIQAVGSTISYLERYTILALTGLATADMDTDGKSEEVVYIDDKQLSRIKDYVDNFAVDVPKFLTYLKVESLEKITVKQFNVAIAALEAKRSAKEKEAKGAKA
jgi:hypothetical protein